MVSISLYISIGIFLSALAAVMGSRLNGLYLANGSVCGFTFYQPKEPDLHELFEMRNVSVCCHCCFALPVEPEELRDLVNNK